MINMLKTFFNWMTRSIGKNFSVVTIILVLTAACSYLGIKAEDIYKWYQGDTVKLIVILMGIFFIMSLVEFSFVEHNLFSIRKNVDNHTKDLSTINDLEKNIHNNTDSINEKIDTIIRQIGDSSAATILLVQMSIQAVPQNIYLAVEPYLELKEMTPLQQQSLLEKFDEVKKSLFIEISYFVKRFYGEKLRTVLVNEPIKVAMRTAFEKCYNDVKEILIKPEYSASDKLAEVNHASYKLIQALFKAILNEEYDIARAKNMEGAAQIAIAETINSKIGEDLKNARSS